jgi:O-antigen/teichoic acid export membrane protein
MSNAFRRIKGFLFENRHVKQTIVKNAVWLSGATLVTRVIRAGLVILAARMLGVEGYGVFSYAMSFAAFLSLLSDVGITGYLTREISRDAEKRSSLVSTAIIVKVVMAVVTFGLTVGAQTLFVKVEGVEALIPLAAMLVFFDTMRLFAFGFSRARNKMEIEGIFIFVTEVAIASLALIFFIPNPSPFVLSAAYVAGSAIGTVLTYLVIRNYLRDLMARPRVSDVKQILAGSLPFAMAGVFGALMINIDTVILGFFTGARDLGLYAAAQRPAQLLYVLPGLIATSVFPLLSRFAGKDDESSKKIIEYASVSVLLVALPITVGGILLGPQLMQLFFGSEYLEATLCFQLLLTTVLFVYPGTVIGNALFSYNMQRKLVYTTAAGAIINVVLDLILIPRYGINGSAVATICSQVVTNGWGWYFLRKRVPFSVLPKLGKIFFATAVMAGVTVGVNSLGAHFFLTVGLSAAAFAIVLLILKERVFIEIKSLIRGS